MCTLTDDQIRDKLKNLSEKPRGLISYQQAGEFHGVVTWEVRKGSMISFKYPTCNDSCEIYHTRFEEHTEVEWHVHGRSQEIIICMEGVLSVIFEDGETKVLRIEDWIHINRGIKHMAVIGNKPCQIIAITIPREKNG